jgi:N utilization substance protein A
VVAELGGEQLHIVGWSADPAVFCARALAPAEVLGVELDDDSHTARITVAPGQLSLAIGRSGENARLAARLTGWRIDIHSDGEDRP